MSKNEKQYSDSSIVELYFARSEKAIEYTNAKYGKYLYTIANNILNDRLDSEESLNDVYLSAWNSIPPHHPDMLLPFLSKIMRRISINRYKKKCCNKRIPSELSVSLSELDECLGTDSEDIIYDAGIITNVINTYLYSISERSQCIFVCRYYCADSITTISKMFKISESSVYKELASIRKGLKEQLLKENILI